MSQYGWRIGAAVAGALALVVAERAGWGVAYMVCAALVLPAIITGLVMGEPERKIERHWPAFLSRGHYAIFIGSFPVAFLIAQQIDAWLGVDILTLMVLDRKSVVSGKGVSVRVELGGRRSLTKKKTIINQITS